MDGTIGCMVNGSRPGMATRHHQAGGRRAGELLDVGGGANAEQIKNAFRT